MSAPTLVAVPFRDEPAGTIVVSCCDGRYIDAVEKLLEDRGVPNHDLITYPGGPAHLDPFSTFLEHQALSDALDFMVHAHKSRTIMLIAHKDCAFYKLKYGTCERARQERDLQVAARHVRGRHRGVDVLLCYLEPQNRGGVAATMMAVLPDDEPTVL